MCIKRLHAVTMRLPTPLTLTLFSVFLLIAARDEPVQVIGLINQSVRLSSDLHRMDPVLDVVWMFQCKNVTIRIAAFINSQFNVFTFTDQFINRLNHSDIMKGLIIRDLREEDSGLYDERITLKNGQETRTGYNLTVYDLVPAPEIQTKLEINSTDWCNFTLHCSVPTNTAAQSVSWKYRHTDTEYTPFNQTVDNGRTIHRSLTPRSHDEQFLCLVQNPVDQKQAAVSAKEICIGFMERGGSGKTGERRRILLPVLLIIILLILTATIVIIWKKRKDSRSPRHTGSADVQVDEASSGAHDEHFPSDSAERAKSHEIQYLEVNAETFSNRAQGSPRTSSHQTVYSEIQYAGNSTEEIIFTTA